MKRRAFIAGLGSATAWSLVAHAQSRAVPKIGIIGSLSQNAIDAFKDGLREYGLTDDNAIIVLGKPASAAPPESIAKTISDLILKNVDLIFASGAVAGNAAKDA